MQHDAPCRPSRPRMRSTTSRPVRRARRRYSRALRALRAPPGCAARPRPARRPSRRSRSAGAMAFDLPNEPPALRPGRQRRAMPAADRPHETPPGRGPSRSRAAHGLRRARTAVARRSVPAPASTITRSRAISRMRHVLVPSAMMSPTRDCVRRLARPGSPTRRRPLTAASPSGSTTENMPRSGMVPCRRDRQALGAGARREQPARSPGPARCAARRRPPRPSRGARPRRCRALASKDARRRRSASPARRAARSVEPLVGWKAARSSMATAATVCCSQRRRARAHEPTWSAPDGARRASPSDTTAASITSAARAREHDALRAAKRHLVVRPPPRAAARWPPRAAAPTCSTRSTAPMSMPSSRLDVATTHGSSPALQLPLHLPPPLLRDRARGAPSRWRPSCPAPNRSSRPCPSGRPVPGAPAWHRRPWARPRRTVRHEAVSPLPAAAQTPATSERAAGRSPRRFAYSSFKPCRQLLAQAARVHEHDRGAVRQRLVQHGRLDDAARWRSAASAAVGRSGGGRRRPARHERPASARSDFHAYVLRRAPRPGPAPPLRACRPRHVGIGSPERRDGRHVAHGHDAPARSRLRTSPPSATTRHGPRAAQEPRHLLARAHRRRQPDALRGTLQQAVQPLQGSAPGAPRACRRPARAPRPR